MRWLFLLVACLTSISALACINDRDTLEFELRNVDALARVRDEKNPRLRIPAAQEIALRAIGGRFERFPTRYYEMRIARLEALPSLTALEYDDLAVAYERIGRTDKAIRILLDSKRVRKTKDDAYRFHANYGTFLVHKWLAQKDRQNMQALKDSIREIEEALLINPDSHFGRERVQLRLEQHWLTGKEFGEGKEPHEDLVGLAGIAMMGLAYELPDAYVLMTDQFLAFGETMLQSFLWLRTKELLSGGHPLVSKKLVTKGTESKFTEEDVRAYRELRADGEKVHQARLAYMNARFDRGEHPDTHPEFWSTWKEGPYPTLRRTGQSAFGTTPPIFLIVGSLAITLIVALLIWRKFV